MLGAMAAVTMLPTVKETLVEAVGWPSLLENEERGQR